MAFFRRVSDDLPMPIGVKGSPRTIVTLALRYTSISPFQITIHFHLHQSADPELLGLTVVLSQSCQYPSYTFQLFYATTASRIFQTSITQRIFP